MSIDTALSIAQSFRRGVNEPIPSGFASATDPDELMQLEHLNQVLAYMRNRGPFRSQIRDHDFNTSSGTTTYSLPGDYWSAVPLTQYNEDAQYPLLGPLSDAEFQVYRERGWSTPHEYIWRVIGYDSTLSSVEGRLFEIYPDPGATVALGFQYVSGNLYLPAAWFASQDQDLHDTLAADTDYCAFDSDVIKLGLMWKYMSNTSNDRAAIQAAKDAFDEEIKLSRFRHHGAKSGTFGRRKRKWYPIPEGNWSFS